MVLQYLRCPGRPGLVEGVHMHAQLKSCICGASANGQHTTKDVTETMVINMITSISVATSSEFAKSPGQANTEAVDVCLLVLLCGVCREMGPVQSSCQGPYMIWLASAKFSVLHATVAMALVCMWSQWLVSILSVPQGSLRYSLRAVQMTGYRWMERIGLESSSSSTGSFLVESNDGNRRDT